MKVLFFATCNFFLTYKLSRRLIEARPRILQKKKCSKNLMNCLNLNIRPSLDKVILSYTLSPSVCQLIVHIYNEDFRLIFLFYLFNYRFSFWFFSHTTIDAFYIYNFIPCSKKKTPLTVILSELANFNSPTTSSFLINFHPSINNITQYILTVCVFIINSDWPSRWMWF